MWYFSHQIQVKNYNLFRREKSVSRKEEIVTTSKSVLQNKTNIISLVTFEEFYKNGWNVSICLLIKGKENI